MLTVSLPKTLGPAAGTLLGLLVFSGMFTPSQAAELRGSTVAPNWALGSPQRPLIRGCSDADAFGLACAGSFGLGPLSDVLDFSLLTRGTTEASFAENVRLNVNGRLEAGSETAGDWWNLWIPNARWVGLGPNAGIGWFLRDPGDPGFGDAIAYVNINNAAHILWGSNNSDEATAALPADFTALLASLGVTPTAANTVNTNADGSFDTTIAQLPTGGSMDCTTDPLCTPTSDFTAAPSVPEPSTWIMLATGLLCVSAWARRRMN